VAFPWEIFQVGQTFSSRPLPRQGTMGITGQYLVVGAPVMLGMEGPAPPTVNIGMVYIMKNMMKNQQHVPQQSRQKLGFNMI